MKTLLKTTQTRLIVCMTAIFALTAPLFYLITKYFYAEDIIDIMEALERGDNIPQLDLDQDILIGMMIQFMLIFLVISFSLFATLRFSARHLWSPFEDTLRKTENFNVSKGEMPGFIHSGISEFETLNRCLEKLMRRDSKMFRIQKEFSENASHELQTPLAVMRGKLDLLLQEHLDARQMEIVSDLCGLASRMSRLNRNLLVLAKIDNGQYSLMKNVEIREMIAASLPDYKMLRPETDIEVIDNTNGAELVVKANPILMESLLKNLIVNAVRHTPADGSIRVEISEYGFLVSNPMADGAALNLTSLFERFGGGHDKKRGIGLGLSIVKAICDYHGWKIRYIPDDGQHIFEVTWTG